jgi:phage gp16-like protein
MATKPKLTLPPDERKRLIKLIHIAKAQLGLSEDDYRGLLQECGGVESSKDLGLQGFKSVMQTLQNMGFKVGSGKTKRGGSLSPKTSHLADGDRKPSSVLVAIWIEMGKSGIVEDASHEALQVFVAGMIKGKQTLMPGVDILDALTPGQVNACRKGLESWRDRELAKRGLDG